MAGGLEREPQFVPPEIKILQGENISLVEDNAKAQRDLAYDKTFDSIEVPAFDLDTTYDMMLSSQFREFFHNWNNIHTTIAMALLGYKTLPTIKAQPNSRIFSGDGRYVHLEGRPPESAYNSDPEIKRRIEEIDRMKPTDPGDEKNYVFFDFAVVIDDSYFAKCRIFQPRRLDDPDTLHLKKRRKIVSNETNWTVYKISDTSTLSIPQEPKKQPLAP